MFAWEQRKLGEIIRTIPFKPFLTSPKENGKFKVIQQGDNPIAGYSDGNPFSKYENVVLFGDHTLSLYKPKQPFFVATDGVKILQSSISMDSYFLYYLLLKYRPNSEGYKRYYSILFNRSSYYPRLNNEQHRIGVNLMKIDNHITLHQREHFSNS